MDKELETLIGRLHDYEGGCENKCLDLKALKFEAKDGGMKLIIPPTDRGYYFKSDTKNPKDAKIVHAARQFCKLIGVPYSFISKNSETMKNEIINCWLSSLKTDKSAVLGKIRKNKDGDEIIRALLPVEFVNIPNAEIASIIGDTIKDDFRLEFSIGDERDDLLFHARFISNETFEICGEVCSTGFSVVASDLGSIPLSVETMLFRNASKASMVANYNGESFFETNYEGIQPAAIRELFPRLMGVMRDQLNDLKSAVRLAKGLTEDGDKINELLNSLRLRKGLSDRFHILLNQEITQRGADNRWDLVNKMSILAKDFEVSTRIKIEKAAGEMIGLNFNKS